MKIAIVGAGIQGCSTAMELAAAGHEVHLFDRASEPMQRASRWNEGKLHLGYVYGRDPSLATARRMIEGSLHFYDFFAQHLDANLDDIGRSTPFVYLVPNDSMMSAGEVGDHLARCDDLLEEAIGAGANYIGERQLPRTRAIDIEPHFDPTRFQAAFRTCERSIDIQRIAALVNDHIKGHPKGHPKITFHPNVSVAGLRRNKFDTFALETADGKAMAPFDRLVNTSWESRLALDKSIGIEPERRWLHRYKVALHISGAPPLDTPSTTMVLGAYGDFVNFENGSYYLSWYPIGKIGESGALQPEEWGDQLTPERKEEFAAQTIAQLGQRLPGLATADWSEATMNVMGGHIFAWGERDITHFETGLHQRDKSGVYDHGDGYYSIDTGKYCTATLYARQCAEMIEAGMR